MDSKHRVEGESKEVSRTWGPLAIFPGLKVKGVPQPATVMINGRPTQGTTGTFYVEWRENGKRRQKPVGNSSREAKDAWKGQVQLLAVDAPEPDSKPEDLSLEAVSVATVFARFLLTTKTTKVPATWDAYRSDLAWASSHLRRHTVASVTRQDLLGLLAGGREQGLSQATINRRVLAVIMALREAGLNITLGERQRPKVATVEVEVYTPEEMRWFLAACDSYQRLLFRRSCSRGSGPGRSPP